MAKAFSLPNAVTLTAEQYEQSYQQSILNPEIFWANQANALLSWYQPWQQVLTGSLAQGNSRWFDGAELNVCYNCIDRHAETSPDRIALIWQSEQMDMVKRLSYGELQRQIALFAGLLQQHGIQAGDRVCIYLPMIPEALIAMLACARLGATHSVVFAGFSAQALHSRIEDAECKIVITADAGRRGGKLIPLKKQVDEALENNTTVHHVFVIRHTGLDISWNSHRDLDYQVLMSETTERAPCRPMPAESPLFVLYTSGSTGKPKGVVHSSAGYLLYALLSFRTIFQPKDTDIYWCTADIGWITGHTYLAYGPLAAGATLLIYEGVPNYPSSQRCWELIDKHQVSIFYSAPTLIRALLREGDESLAHYQLNSLRLLGSVGEPINPEVWQWYFEKVGQKRCPIVDTWWQTETGGIAMTTIPSTHPAKPGVAGLPFFGIIPALLDQQDQEIQGSGSGKLVLKQSWPGQLRTVLGDHERFLKAYISSQGYFITGDGAERDADGYYRITGRIDDVINCSGHRLGTAEIESALVLHPSVAEAAVVGYPHDLKGEAVAAFVLLKQDAVVDEQLGLELMRQVSQHISPIAKPERIYVVANLPKTRSGKIMRRILRKLAEGNVDDLGDVSTLADPGVLEELRNPLGRWGE